MIKFLDIVLRDIKQGNYCAKSVELQLFFLDMMNNIVPYISNCLYEEIFPVFDKLLSMCSEVITDKVLHKCIIAFVDKYTLKSKAHKNSLTIFMKNLMEMKPKHSKNGKKNNVPHLHQHHNNNMEGEELEES